MIAGLTGGCYVVHIGSQTSLSPDASRLRVRADDYVVLMDIERGKYLAVDGRRSRELSELIEGWPSPACDLSLIREGAGIHNGIRLSGSSGSCCTAIC